MNYQAGLVWGRIPELRFVYHPTSKMAFAVALDSPEQYVGKSAGGRNDYLSRRARRIAMPRNSTTTDHDTGHAQRGS